jgi:hypothetical protein
MPGVFSVEQGLHQRGTDDHQVSETCHFPRLRPVRYAKSDADHRRRVDITHAPYQLWGRR